AEVKNMCLREYTEEEIKEMFREDGIEQTNKKIIVKLLSKGKSPEEIHDLLDIPLEEIVKIKDRELTPV
ncbi:MAG: hypothetical protein IJM14_00015, partial [Lachnospiraceae bacterium]|nr:hypothetical protein [Lachnospiraceae bacterium]